MLYVFGDSFANGFGILPDYAHINLVAKVFKTEIKNLGFLGSSLEYTFTKFEEQRNNFAENDIIIIMLTMLDKTHFFPDRPNISGPWSFKEFKNYSDDEQNAVELFYEKLHNPRNTVINLYNFLHSVQDITVRKKCKTVIFHSFDSYYNSSINNERYPDLHIAKGNLWFNMKREIRDVDLLNHYMEHHFVNDPRILHFSKQNHFILANSIVSAIRNKTEIDLDNIILENIY